MKKSVKTLIPHGPESDMHEPVSERSHRKPDGQGNGGRAWEFAGAPHAPQKGPARGALLARLMNLGTVVAAVGAARAVAARSAPVSATDWVLNAVKLQRKPSAASRAVYALGVGAVGVGVGVGVALLLAPRSGAQARERLRRGIRVLRQGAASVVAPSAEEPAPHRAEPAAKPEVLDGVGHTPTPSPDYYVPSV